MLLFGSQIARFLYSFTCSNCETFSKAVFLASKHPNPHMISSDIRQNTCFSNTPVVEIQVTLFTFSSVVAYFSLSKCLLAQCITQSIGYITLSYCHLVCMFCRHTLFPQRASQTIALFLHLMLLSLLVKTKQMDIANNWEQEILKTSFTLQQWWAHNHLCRSNTKEEPLKCRLPMFGKPKSFTEIEFDRYIIVKAHVELKGWWFSGKI